MFVAFLVFPLSLLGGRNEKFCCKQGTRTTQELTFMSIEKCSNRIHTERWTYAIIQCGTETEPNRVEHVRECVCVRIAINCWNAIWCAHAQWSKNGSMWDDSLLPRRFAFVRRYVECVCLCRTLRFINGVALHAIRVRTNILPHLHTHTRTHILDISCMVRVCVCVRVCSAYMWPAPLNIRKQIHYNSNNLVTCIHVQAAQWKMGSNQLASRLCLHFAHFVRCMRVFVGQAVDWFQ